MISYTKNAINIVRNLFISIAALCPALVLQRMARYPNYDPSARFLGGTAADAISKERSSGWKSPEKGLVNHSRRAISKKLNPNSTSKTTFVSWTFAKYCMSSGIL
jgi:hypothetical protein